MFLSSRHLAVCVCMLTAVPNSVGPGTVACQSPLSMGFPRQEFWTGLLFPPPGDLSDPRIKPTSLVSSALVGGLFTVVPGEPSNHLNTDLEGSYTHHHTTHAEHCLGNSGGHRVDSGLLKMQIRWCKQSEWDSFML